MLAEVRELLHHEPPLRSPAHTTDDELAMTPVAFSHSLLSDGSRLLARTTTTAGGRRTGDHPAFHAHGVLLPPGRGLPGGHLPVSAWNSPGWAGTAPSGGLPGPLESLPSSGLLHPDALVAFAVSRAPWLTVFLAALHRLAEEASAPRIVLVEHRSTDVAHWIALACTVLPRDKAEPLTFTTYTRLPWLAPQQIIGTAPQDAATLSGDVRVSTEPGGAGQFLMLDCTGRPPTGPVRDGWAETAARIWLGRSPKLFQDAATPPGAAFAPGPLAAAALLADVQPGPNGRAAAAEWAGEHGRNQAGDRLQRLADALSAPATDRTATELAALTRLFTLLSGRAPVTVTAPWRALRPGPRRRPGSARGLRAGRPPAQDQLRLRSVPSFATDCFIAWTSLPGANRAWDKTRTALLDTVLRPVLRELSAPSIASVERCLEHAGPHRAEEFRAWNRPGTLTRLTRLTRRLGGLGRSR